jgi:hypothetical protein
VRPGSIALAFLLACGGAEKTRPQLPDRGGARAAFGDDDRFVPAYEKSELNKALIAERALEATGERKLAELEAQGPEASNDPLRVARADLAVRRRFIASLEACEASGTWCPPRLDDPVWHFDYDANEQPPLDAPLVFDLAGWRKLADELHGRACACRTLVCVDSVGVAIDQLDRKPTPPVQGDEAASLAITRARECLFRLRGKSNRPPPSRVIDE